MQQFCPGARSMQGLWHVDLDSFGLLANIPHQHGTLFGTGDTM